ncbi:hypothetical protein ACFFRE_13765, partial [Aciditerrimonas ferrireducens]
MHRERGGGGRRSGGTRWRWWRGAAGPVVVGAVVVGAVLAAVRHGEGPGVVSELVAAEAVA